MSNAVDVGAALLGAQCPICSRTGLTAVDAGVEVQPAHQSDTRAACKACRASFNWPSCYRAASPSSPQRAGTDQLVPLNPKVKVGWFEWGGRIGRSTFIGRIVLCVALGAACAWALTASRFPLLVVLLVALAFKQLFVMQCVKRAQDCGWSSWTALLAVLPPIDAVWALILAFKEGTNGENRYGPSPAENQNEMSESSAEDREKDRARLVATMRGVS